MRHKIGDKFKLKEGKEHDFYRINFKHELEILDINNECSFTCLYLISDNEWFNQEELNFHYELIEETQIGGNHYSKLKIDPYEYSMVNELNPLQMNAIKYITRYKDKNGVEDLKKAIHTINRLIDYEDNK